MTLLSYLNPYTESGALYRVIKKEALYVHLYKNFSYDTGSDVTTLMKQGRNKSHKIPQIHDFCGSSPVIFAEYSPSNVNNFSQLFL